MSKPYYNIGGTTQGEFGIRVGSDGVGELRLIHDGADGTIRNDAGVLYLKNGADIGLSIGADGLIDLIGPVATSGSEGVVGQVLSSQGAGQPAVWRTSAGASIDLGYNFTTVTTSTDPTSQQLGYNQTTYAATTVLRIDSLAFGNFNADTILSLLQAGNRVYMQQRNDSAKAVVFEVTAPGTDMTGWWSIPVIYIQSRGILFPNNADLTVVFILSTSSSASANPTASVGLTAVNGTATTWMRSDAAPALSVSIVPTWSGIHTFAATRVILSNAGGPVLELEDTDAGTDLTSWRLRNNGGSLVFSPENDAGTGLNEALRITRSTTAVTAINLGNATDNNTFSFLGSGLTTHAGSVKFTLAALTTGPVAAINLESAQPNLIFNETDATTGERVWRFVASNGGFLIQATDNTGVGTTNTALQITRSAEALATINFGNATNNPTFGFLGTGTMSVGGLFSSSGSAAQRAILNSTAGNGAYITFQRSSTSLSDFGNSAQVFSGGTLDNIGLGTRSTQGMDLGTNGVVRFKIDGTTGLTSILDVSGGTFYTAGFREIPQNSKSAAYTLVLSDSGKHIFHPSADTTARIWTIPANSSVAFPIGTAVTFINQNAGGVITISITTDTMRLSPGGTTGSRTLAANGVATAIKVTSTEWIISGTGLT